MNYNYILILIFIFLILFLLFFLINKYFNVIIYENFLEENSSLEEETECNSFFDKNSYCVLDVDENKCDCKYQKDNVKYIFESPENCCKRNCNKLSAENCVNRDRKTKIPYYCNIGGECKKYEGTIIDSHIAANNCGNDSLNNQILLPYSSKEECEKSVDYCDKYNKLNQSNSLRKSECIKDTNCGFCTNDSGGGKCISGTAEGPLDMQKYYYCNANTRDNINKYIYGDHSAALLQKNVLF